MKACGLQPPQNIYHKFEKHDWLTDFSRPSRGVGDPSRNQKAAGNQRDHSFDLTNVRSQSRCLSHRIKNHMLAYSVEYCKIFQRCKTALKRINGARAVNADGAFRSTTISGTGGFSNQGSRGTDWGGSLLQIFKMNSQALRVDSFGCLRSKNLAISR